MKIKFIIPQITRAVKENVERCGWGNRVRQGTVGLSEELATQCATVCVDAFNMGNKSQYELSVQKYMQDGLTRAEAQEKATQDLIAETLLSAAGGFATNSISGAVIDLGKRKKGSGETASLLQSALELPSDSPAHKLAAELSDKLETALTEQGIDAADLYEMSRTEQDALIERTMDAAISDRELGELNQLMGESLTQTDNRGNVEVQENRIDEVYADAMAEGHITIESVREYAQALEAADAESMSRYLEGVGYETNTTDSAREHSRATVIRISGDTALHNISQVQFSPGGGRHGPNSYLKFSTTDLGIIKIVFGDPETYRTSGNERATIIFAEEMK